jgi:hypothetical protein
MRIRNLASFFLVSIIAVFLWAGCGDDGTAPKTKTPPPTDLEHVWDQRFGDADDQYGTAVTTDASGNVIVAGSFNGSVDFGGGALTCVGVDDIFIAKFDADSTHIWSERFGGDFDQIPRDVAIDASGNIIVTGRFWGDVDFGGGTLNSAGTSDVFVAKFTPGGSHLWSKRFGDGVLQEGTGVAVDASGNVFITGNNWGTVDFGGSALISAGHSDAFLAKFDPDGTHLWSDRYGGASEEYPRHVTVDASGNVIVVGDFYGSVDFGGGTLNSAGSNDVFVAKFDPDGTHLWSKSFGDPDDDSATRIAADASGNVVITGYFGGRTNFGGGTLTSAGGNDGFFAKFDANGTHLWSKSFGAGGDEAASDVAVDASGNVIMTGHFQGTVDFGGGAYTSQGSYDIFIARFNSDGGHLWSDYFGDASEQVPRGVAVDASGNAVITGYFSGTLDFGGGGAASAGGSDIFVAKFGPSPGT